jgi:hypothetical protein
VLLFFLKKGKMEDTKSVAYHSGDWVKRIWFITQVNEKLIAKNP